MKTLSVLGICCLVATVVMSRLAGSGELKPAAAAPLPSSDPVMLVVSFYKVLLQKEAPTRTLLFCNCSGSIASCFFR